MPALNGTNAKKAKAEAGKDPFAPLPDGYYKAKLIKVESSKSSKDNPMWTWHWKIEGTEKKLRDWTVLGDSHLWKVGAIFEAFGVPTTTSTDDLLGKVIIITVGSEVANEGKSKGKVFNNVANYPDQNVTVGAHDGSDQVNTDDDKPGF